VGVAAICLGAGRNTKDDVIDPAVGFMMNARLGDFVAAGEPLLFVHHDGVGVDAARSYLAGAFTFGASPPPPGPLVIERIGSPVA
jgi:pyrimidine-nucleoside phosphorylase/thymidine phosphorylase